MSCFEVVEFHNGRYRIALKNLDMAKVEDPPLTTPTSYSMPLRGNKVVSESCLFIPATRPMAEQWVRESIERIERNLAYYAPRVLR